MCTERNRIGFGDRELLVFKVCSVFGCNGVPQVLNAFFGVLYDFGLAFLIWFFVCTIFLA